jgi:hypothetical protein
MDKDELTTATDGRRNSMTDFKRLTIAKCRESTSVLSGLSGIAGTYFHLYIDLVKQVLVTFKDSISILLPLFKKYFQDYFFYGFIVR